MKKIALTTLLFIAFVTIAKSQYTISFTATGATNSINRITAQNLRTGMSVTFDGNSTLILQSTTEILNKVLKNNDLVYPNPFENSTTLSFNSKGGQVIVSVFNSLGQSVINQSYELSAANHQLKLTMPNTGMYFVEISENSRTSSYKLLCNRSESKAANIEYSGFSDPKSEFSQSKQTQKGFKGQYTLDFQFGDAIKFWFKGGIYTAVLTDYTINSNKTIQANFNSLVDIDNNTYPIVTIGTQVWMAKNLATTRYSDGVSVTFVSGKEWWNGLYSPGMCWYNNNIVNKTIHGGMYSWYVVDKASNGNHNICPSGWHVPQDVEWTTLQNYLISNGYNYDSSFSGNKISKSMATSTGWFFSDIEGVIGNSDYPMFQNISGFSALPSGYRYGNGDFCNLGGYAFWWSIKQFDTENAWFCGLLYDNTVCYFGHNYKGNGFSIRCVKD